MNHTALGFLCYFLELVLYTLGIFLICGLLIHLIEHLFSRLMGRGSDVLFNITSVIGTPVHELGHAAMCLLFGHKITAMRLWQFRHSGSGTTYGYVEHSWSRRNLWARIGNLFIGMGPLFSGIGVTVLMLWLCFPGLWNEYLQNSYALVSSEGIPFGTLISGLFALLGGIPGAFRADWLRSLLGIVVILPVSLHVSMSPADIKGSLGSLPIILPLLAVFGCATYWTPAQAPIIAFFRLMSFRLLSLFALVIAFALVWLALAALIRAARVFISWF